MKKLILNIFLLFLSSFVVAQTMDELQGINNKSKNQFIKPEALDQLMISLRKFESSPVRGQDTLLLETYKSISSAYMANNHFKQAYEVFQKYIFRKENMLSDDKTNYLNKKIESVKSMSQKDDGDELVLQKQLNELKENNDTMDQRQNSFKRNFSLGLIILTAIFALILVSTGIRMMNLRSSLLKNRDRMKMIHRVAVIGNFGTGLRNRLKAVIALGEKDAVGIRDDLNKHDQSSALTKDANKIIIKLEKSFRSIDESI